MVTSKETAGYSGTPLVKKLGIKPAFRIIVINHPSDYWELIGPLPEDVQRRTRLAGQFDFIQLFAVSQKDLRTRLTKLKKAMVSNGMLWISWPKKSSGKKTDLDGNTVRSLGLKAGLVDVKVCAIDETWSGLKFVVRVKDRLKTKG